MARLSVTMRAQRLLREHLGIATMEMATRMVWLLLMQLIDECGTDGILHLGTHIENLNTIAIGFHMRETDLETQLDYLVRRQFLVRPQPDCLALPTMLTLSAKAAAARQNGLKGGRPRKGAPAPPDQTTLLLPVRGGLDTVAEEGHAETQAETQASRASAGARARTTTTTTQVRDSESGSGGSGTPLRAREKTQTGVPASRQAIHAELHGTAPAPDIVRFAAEVGAVLGLTTNEAARSCAHVAWWLKQGYSREEVLAVAQRVAGRPNRPPGGLRFRYVEKALHDAPPLGSLPPVAAALPSSPSSPSEAAWHREWVALLTNGPFKPGRPTWEEYRARRAAEASAQASAAAAPTLRRAAG